jgi:hypothetical protein
MPCGDCGESLKVDDSDHHKCDRYRKADYEAIQLYGDSDELISGFQEAFEEWLTEPHGLFALYLAQRGKTT